jgi:hypothetical protein
MGPDDLTGGYREDAFAGLPERYRPSCSNQKFERGTLRNRKFPYVVDNAVSLAPASASRLLLSKKFHAGAFLGRKHGGSEQ